MFLQYSTLPYLQSQSYLLHIKQKSGWKIILKKWNLYFIEKKRQSGQIKAIFTPMTDSIKIKVAIPGTTRNQLEMDVSDYNLKSMGDLCNYIIAHREDLPKSTENKDFKKECNELFKNCRPLQFTLHKSNMTFADFANTKGAKLASICRHYIEQYISLPRGKRELFIKKVELIKIEEAIKKQRNVTLLYHRKYRTVSPCFIAHSPAQARSYLVVYEELPKMSRFEKECHAENPFKAYRICHIKNVKVEEDEAFHTRSNILFKKAAGYREHFDPFLCYGQELRVVLTKEGVQLYKKATTNRPRILKVPAASKKKTDAKVRAKGTSESIAFALESEIPGEYTMECSPELAKVYFPQFLDTAEIITPTILRNYFRQRFLNAARKYGIMDLPTHR